MKILKNFSILRKRFCAFSAIVLLSSCSAPSESSLSALVGYSSPTPAPLANSAITFSPASYDYGTTLINAPGPSNAYLVSNASAYPLILSSITSSNTDFSIQSNQCSGVLASSASCTFNINFSPTTSGNLSSLITLSYTSPGVPGIFSSVLSVTGASTSLVSFAGLTSITQVSTTSVKLNWTGITGASTYQAYDVTSGRILLASVIPSSACTGTACSYVVTGLTPNTTYTYQVRATDVGGVQEGNIVSQTATTQAAAVFANIADISGNEASTFTTANLSCGDSYSSTNLFSITAQSDSTANCALTATTGASAKVSCTPSYHAAGGVHASWADNVTVQCVINGSTYSKTFAVNVTNTNRNPIIQLSSSTAQTVSAQFPIAAVTASE